MQLKSQRINDPIYGMIYVHFPIIFELIDHPFFQRLRNIQQAGLASFVFPGATHTRFAHSIGAMHLMDQAIKTLKEKGVSISQEEHQAALIAILLHDIGHGPFSHALEFTLIEGVSHEDLSALILQNLNLFFDQKLNLSQDIFAGKHPKTFLTQMVAGQLDMDRLDYLQRDSFYAGVNEASIGARRLIDLLNVKNNQLCLENKAIYSLEQFFLARKIMYLQVYLHKTVIGVEGLLLKILQRAKALCLQGEKLFASEALHFFLTKKLSFSDFLNHSDLLKVFLELDDAQIWTAIRVWMKHADFILSDLCTRLLYRKLPCVEQANQPFSSEKIEEKCEKIVKKFPISTAETNYYLLTRAEDFQIYDIEKPLYILDKNEDLVALHTKNPALKTQVLKQYFLAYPREILNL